MGIISKRIYKTRRFKTGKKCLHALTMVAGLALIACALSTPDRALAQTACPTPTDFTGMPRLVGQITPGILCQSGVTGGSGAEYDNAATTNIDVNVFAGPGNTTGIFSIWTPDNAPRPAGANPVRIVFAPAGGTSRTTIPTATCPGATINGIGTTLVEVTLANISACTLFVAAPAGPGRCVNLIHGYAGACE